MYRFKPFILLCILPLAGLFSQQRQFTLTDAGIGTDNRILVSADNPVPAGVTYRTLILGDADTLSHRPLTLYPQQSSYSSGRKELRIYNHFGYFVYDEANRAWETRDFIEPFGRDRSVSPLALLPLYDSPDGRYTAYIREEAGLRTSLHLYDHHRNVSLYITGEIPREFSVEMVKWSPDSRYFVYRRDKELYYFSIDQYLSGRIPAEDFRKIGHRFMNSAAWGQGNYLYLISGNLIYRLHSSEFFTRAFYADPFHKGSVWGRIPVKFDPLFDDFSISPGGAALFLVKDQQDGFLFPLDQTSEGGRTLRQLPSLSVPPGQVLADYRWLTPHRMGLFVTDTATRKGSLFSFDLREEGRFSSLLEEEGVRGFAAGPDGKEWAVYLDDRVVILDGAGGEILHSHQVESPLQVYWTDEGYLILGAHRIQEVRNGEARVLGLSQVEQSGFTAANEIVARTEGRLYRLAEGMSWEPYAGDSLRPHRLSTEEYRIYLDDRSGGWYAHSLKVRRIASYTTEELLTPQAELPGETLPVQLRGTIRDVPWYFSQGNSQGEKEVTLVINAVNSAEGLNRMMAILEGYGIQATFFLNGDFINNFPDGTRMIAQSDHLVGSLFYTYFDMSDPKYQINREFLKKGLARNEDDYFIVTGREMAMLWHTPYYYINREILDTTGILDYTFIGKELNVYDWVGIHHRAGRQAHYKETIPLIESLLEQVRPGAVIPVTLGRFAEREDYLYMQLAMLIEGLILKGYRIVPLYDLMDDNS